MSQPTQPHQASSSSHSSSQSPQLVQPQGLGLYVPPSLSGSYPQPPAQRRRVNEDIFLNIVLYIGSLLLIGAAGLFVTSVTSSKDETAIFRVLAMALGAVIFYGAGLLTYRFVERLRIASYSFAATGLAFIPLTGIAVYVLEIWTEGRYIWLLTSLVGTAAIVGACTLMRNRVMAYLLISFIVSDSLAATKVAALPFVWYFVSLTVVATVLGLILHFAPNAAPKGIREGLVDSSRIFVPATAIAIFFFTSDLSYADTGIAFAVMSVHAILFTWLNGTADYYAQARVYPIASILCFVLDSNHGPWFPSIFFVSVLLVNVISVYAFVPRLQQNLGEGVESHADHAAPNQQMPLIPWAQDALQPRTDKKAWLPAVDACVGVFFSFLAVLDAFYAAYATHSSAHVTRWSTFLPYAEGRQGLFPAPWVIGVLCIVSFLLYRKAVQPLVLMIFAAIIPVIAMYLSPNNQGTFYLFFAAAIVIYLLSTKAPEVRTAGAVLSNIGYAIGMIQLFLALIPEMRTSESLLMFAMVCSAIALLTFAFSQNGAAQNVSYRLNEMSAYLILGVFALFAGYSISIIDGAVHDRFWISFSLFAGAVLFVSTLSALLLGRALQLPDVVGSARSTVVSAVRIALYTALAIAMIGSRHYLLFGPQKEYVAVALPAVLTVIYVALGLFMAAGSSVRSELLTIARFPICWSVVLLAISGNVKDSVVSFLIIVLLAGQALCSVLLYARSKRIYEAYAATTFFTLGAVLSAIHTVADIDQLLLSVAAPALLVVLWAVAIFFKAPHMQIGASIIVTVFCIGSLWNLFHAEKSTMEVTLLGYYTLFAVIILFVLKVMLPVEVSGAKATIRPYISVPAGNRTVELPMHGPLGSPYPRFMPRRPLAQAIYAPVNTLLMIPAVYALGLMTFFGLIFDYEQVELNALLWGLFALSFVSVSKPKSLPAIGTVAFTLFIARLVLDYLSYNPLSVILEVILLALLAFTTAKVLSNLIAKKPLDTQASDAPLYWALGLQVFLTLVTWAVPADGPDIVVLVLGITLTLLSALLLDRVWTYIATALVTLDLAILLNGLNPLTLFIISILLIAGVIWRLLARQNKQDAVAPQQDPAQIVDYPQELQEPQAEGTSPQNQVANAQVQQHQVAPQGYQPRDGENI